MVHETTDIGILGCGRYGSRIAADVTDGGDPDTRITALYNRTPERARSLAGSLDCEYETVVAEDPRGLANNCDIVVEAASQSAVEACAVPILETGTDIVVLSVGAFADGALLSSVTDVATDNGARVHVPSGSIAGLDGVLAAAEGSIDSVSITGYRPPRYVGAYVDDSTDVEALTDGSVIFEGTAREAAAAFPGHMNIAMALALASKINPDAVTVTIVLERDAPRSKYEIRVDAATGTVETVVRNAEHPAGHDVTQSVVQSTIATVNAVTGAVSIGT